jgi:hypothetical protein
MQRLVWILIFVLVVLHQDYWQWDEAGLVFGFLPYSLVYHAGISLAAAIVWWLATRYCWPLSADAMPIHGANEDASR